MPTTLIRSLDRLDPALQGGVVTIGNFDGVHVGHQALLERVVKKAREDQVPSFVITFEPHPFEFFNQDRPIPRLTRLREKFIALSDCGIDHVIILKFNQKLARISASDFINKMLCQSLRPRHILVGDDFRFGYQRQGDFTMLQEMGQASNFTVEAMPSVIVAGERVSSTRIRQALAKDELDLTTQLLGHSYAMMGRVARGNQLGRELGFPTANINVHRQMTPVKGIYTVLVHGLGGRPLPGAASVGTRPTVDHGSRMLLEVHLLDFNRDIYGQYVSVEFCKKLREEEKYSNLSILRDRIAEDVETTREYFMTGGYERL